jgi:hypothetical protein
MNPIAAHKDELKKLLENLPGDTAVSGIRPASLIAIMDSLTLASSQKEESDSAAERRWENEGGNPGQLQQLPCDDRKGVATTAPVRGTLKHSATRPILHAPDPIPRNYARC